MKANTGNKQLDYKIERAFQKYAEKLALLDIETGETRTLQNATPVTNVILARRLRQGKNRYWDLEEDENGNIIAIKPYSEERVMTMLHRREVKEVKINDTFADFAARM